MSAERAPDHEVIWLQPQCYDESPDGRLWCKDPVFDNCEDCSLAPTKYMRADLFDALKSQRDRYRAALEWVKRWEDALDFHSTVETRELLEAIDAALKDD